MNPSTKLFVCLYSDANFFAVNLLENLLSKNCYVNIFTNEVGAWEKKTQHIAFKSKFAFVDNKKNFTESVYNYAVFVGGFIKSKNAFLDYKKFKSIKGLEMAKIVSLFSLESFDSSMVESMERTSNEAIMFIGDLIGPRIDLDSDLLMPTTLSEILWKRKMTIPVGEVFYPVFIRDAVTKVIKWLFAFGPYGKVTLLLGNQVSASTFWQNNRKFFPELTLNSFSGMSNRKFPKTYEVNRISSDLNFSLDETYTWLKNNWNNQTQRVEKPRKVFKIKSSTNKSPVSNKVRLAVLTIILILLFPVATLLVSAGGAFLSYKSLVGGKQSLATNTFLVTRGLASVSKASSRVLEHIPLLGSFYKETAFASVFIEQSSRIAQEAIPVVTDSSQLFKKILGTEVYDSWELSNSLSIKLGRVYEEIKELKDITEAASEKKVILSNKVLAKVSFDKAITIISQTRNLTERLPYLLGQDESKTYLVLLENNMELRPTGGFIGSFGLVTFDGGRLSDLVINDVYSADGQLNGHVEPPEPIKKYLGEANWWLRDSNWDPDFTTSAKRAEWFLDKEISKKVDGVVSIDLYLIRSVLQTVGPIFLSDYNLTINSENLYEKTQAEVENDFFPGTHKKASFITSLSRSLLAEITKLEASSELSVLKSFYESLDGRHLQLYLHDELSQKALSTLRWDGSVFVPNCGVDCYPDLFGVVEANVGVNKVNYFIDRNIKLDVSLGLYKIDHTATLELTNSANKALGPSSRYKAYIRILVPTESSINSVVVKNADYSEELPFEIFTIKDHKEVGVLVEVLGGNTKTIEFSWKTPIEEESKYNNYGLYIRKQAGTENGPISVTVGGNGLEVEPDPRFNLTDSGFYSYNTTLARDLFLRLSW